MSGIEFNPMYSREDTYDAGHGTSLLEVAKKHFLLVEHFSGFMLRFLWVDEDGTVEVACSISHPHFLNPVQFFKKFKLHIENQTHLVYL